jgi:hypothetical protein
MKETRFIFYTQEGNVSRLPNDFNRRSRALAVREEPKVPAVYVEPLIAAGLAAFFLIALLRKD